MNPNLTITLEKFRAAVQDSAIEARQIFPELPFNFGGINPVNDESFRYETTPLNTTVFAYTGGDGVHYSLLEITDRIQPIVMTVPMSFGQSIKSYNWILGENLYEFLSLGYYNGWFPLEQLCYQQDWAIGFYKNEWQEEEINLRGDFLFIKMLRSKLGYKHLQLNLDRLKVLEVKYFDHLQFKDNIIGLSQKP